MLVLEAEDATVFIIGEGVVELVCYLLLEWSIRSLSLNSMIEVLLSLDAWKLKSRVYEVVWQHLLIPIERFIYVLFLSSVHDQRDGKTSYLPLEDKFIKALL